MKKLLLLLLLFQLIFSCSMNNFEKIKDDSNDIGKDSDEVGRTISSQPEKSVEETDSFLKDDENVDLFADDQADGVFIEGEEKNKAPDKSVATLTHLESGQKTPAHKSSGKFFQHTVKKSETLMLIAFEIYGDYSRWKELRQLNSSVLKDFSHLEEGIILNYLPAKNPYVRPTGNPYLIKRGDTLSKVSRKVYGTNQKWKAIWKNNPRQIKNPDLIFAGFTLFYPNSKENQLVYSY